MADNLYDISAHAAGAAETVGTIGARIVEARENTGLTTPQLARRLGIKAQTLFAWETGKSEPRANRLAMLAGILGVSPGWLLTGHGDAPASIEGPNDLTAMRTEMIALKSSLQANLDELNRMLSNINHMIEPEKKSA